MLSYARRSMKRPLETLPREGWWPGLCNGYGGAGRESSCSPIAGKTDQHPDDLAVCFPVCPPFLPKGFNQQQATPAYLIGAGILTDRHVVARVADVNDEREPVGYHAEPYDGHDRGFCPGL